MPDFAWVKGVLGFPLKVFVNRPIDEERFPQVFWNNRDQSQHSGEDACTRCDGYGWDADWGGPYTCPVCGGSGERQEILRVEKMLE